MLKAGVLLHLGVLASADCYLHNPRGSNNRLDDENRDRNNADRLFDSQNNNRGGSNVGQVYYYVNSTIPIQWSVQHSCGNPNNNCEMVIQVMCDSRIRDGTTTNTIPIRPNDCYNWDCDTDVRFGRHESYEYYMNCKYRSRNKGLFTSSQNLKGHSAIYTRQNPNGARRGLECPEERDYYPYWGPTPWRDVAVLTNDCVRCDMYRAESQNVKGRHYCRVPITGFMRWYETAPHNEKTLLPLSQIECQNITYWDRDTNETAHGEWTLHPAFNIPPPVCSCNPWARDNHHGNVINGEWAGIDWKVPDWLSQLAAPEQCVLRMRYNISTGDYEGFADTTTPAPGVDYRHNKQPIGDETIAANVDIGGYYGVGKNNTRDYYLRNNPRPNAFGDTLSVPLQLAINTAQYGRTFEDRTHKFAVRVIPTQSVRDDIENGGAVLTNVNVRGKRGNIVQTYPGTEYDFVPTTLYCKDGVDYVHFQWTGSNTNPDNNAGQGRQGSDRHNVVSLRRKNYEEPPISLGLTDNLGTPVFGHYGNSYPAHLNDWSFLGFDKNDMSKLAINAPYQFGGELSELDDSGTYFDLGIRRCGNGASKGKYHYLCTRNNNFSNRSQKAKVDVSGSSVAMLQMTNSHSIYQVGSATIITAPGANAVAIQSFQVVSTPPAQSAAFQQADINAASDITCISNFDGSGGLSVTLKMKYETNAMKSFDLVRAETAQGPYESVDDATEDGGLAIAQIYRGGCYTVQSSPNGGVIAGIVIGVFAGVGCIAFGVWWKFGRGGSKKGHI